jgi:energy-converting hydrogenase Eha subunit H
MKQIKIILWIALAVLVTANVYITVEAVASGAEVVDLEKESQILTNNSQGLRNEIAKASSLSAIGAKATELQFVKPMQIVYLGQKEVALKLP